MKQTKLESFFTFTPNNKNKNKIYFIFDQPNKVAFFSSELKEGDQFIVKKNGYNLYTRNNEGEKLGKEKTEKKVIPLLKSNLQKAVRRKKTEIAINSLRMLIRLDPLNLMRRLPIIIVEDTELHDSITIPVWMMLAEGNYELKDKDESIFVDIIKNLCECDSFYPCYDLPKDLVLQDKIDLKFCEG